MKIRNCKMCHEFLLHDAPPTVTEHNGKWKIRCSRDGCSMESCNGHITEDQAIGCWNFQNVEFCECGGTTVYVGPYRIDHPDGRTTWMERVYCGSKCGRMAYAATAQTALDNWNAGLIIAQKAA